MSEEKRNTAEQIGTLGSCLIEGDPEQEARERKIKRRALGISVSLQCVALVALVLLPLLGRTEKISLNIVTPIPPYRAVRPHAIPDHPAAHPQPQPTGFVVPTIIPYVIVTRESARTNDGDTRDSEPNLNESVPIPGIEGGIFGRRGTPPPPSDPRGDAQKRVTRGGDVQQALLIRRVEPEYPRLMRAVRRSGKVELHAVISTDGTIESLEAISGDPAFYDSAMGAVRQWRYRPTYLNGQPVEVETIITVIYSLGQQ